MINSTEFIDSKIFFLSYSSSIRFIVSHPGVA